MTIQRDWRLGNLTPNQLAVFRTHSDGKWFTPSEHSEVTLLALYDRGLLEHDSRTRHYRVPKGLIDIAHHIYQGEQWSPDGIE